MSDKSYLNILKGGVLLSFVILFFVFGDLLFPFISSKQLSFNILIEVLLLVGVIFLIKYPKYLPTKSQLSWGIIAYFLAILLSLFVSYDFNLSFWGDIERMLGYFHLLHFLALYFIIITAFRSKKDFSLLLNTLIGSAVLIALYAIFKHDANATIGNRAYVAAMMIFAIFLQALFLIKNKDWWIKGIYAIGIIISFIGFIKADISGAQAGLVLGVLSALFIGTIISKNRTIKIISFSSLGILIILVTLLFTFRSHPVFDNSYLGKSLRDFSTDNVTLNTRLISYQSAGKYLVDHPVSMIFGVGHGCYALIFDKYFNPKFYDYDRAATYFDRAHNNIIDIITTTGVIGLLAYLSIFVFLFIYLLRAYRNNFKEDNLGDQKVNGVEFSILIGLLVAYFVQNLAVFDSFATYLYFIVILAFVNYVGNKKSIQQQKKDIKISNIITYVLLPIFVILIIFSLNKNINTFSMLKKTIAAYSYSYTKGIIAGSEKFTEALSSNTGLERDARESYINLILENSNLILKAVKDPQAESAISLAIEVSEKNEQYNIYDSLILTRLSKIYDLAGQFYLTKGNREKASHYSNLALDTLGRAIESSPGRVPLYLTRANIFLNLGEADKALADIEIAKNLNPKMPEPYCQLAHFSFIFEKEEDFLSNFKICTELGGLSLMNWGDFIKAIEIRYAQENNTTSLISVYESFLLANPQDTDIISKLALVYFEVKDFVKARETALKLIEIDQTYQKDVDLFLEKINNYQIE
jgi:O-antigen ligase